MNNMYSEAKGYKCKVLKNSLQESLGLAPIFILIILRLNMSEVFYELNPLNTKRIRLIYKNSVRTAL